MKTRPHKIIKLLSFLLLTGMSIFPSGANATPLGWTVDQSAEHSIVTTDTGVRWLSPTATTNQSRAEALSLNPDYELATSDDFLALLGAYEIPVTPWPHMGSEVWVSGIPDGIQMFFDDFGSIRSNDWGFNSLPAFLEGDAVSVVARIEGHDKYKAAWQPHWEFNPSPKWGSWLIDSDIAVGGEAPAPVPTPEPASVILMGTGLAALLIFRKYINNPAHRTGVSRSN